MSEEWRIIPSFPDYEASSEGRIRRIAVVRYGRKPGIIKACASKWNGYLSATLCRNGEHITIRWHRVIAEAFIPNPDNKPEVNHLDADKINNRPSNLQWVTHQENEDHAKANGLKASGRRCSLKAASRKLDENQILEVRTLIASGERQKAVASMFGITQPHISKIVNGLRWGWL